MKLPGNMRKQGFGMWVSTYLSRMGLINELEWEGKPTGRKCKVILSTPRETIRLAARIFSTVQTKMAGVNYADHPDGYTNNLDELEAYQIDPYKSKGRLRRIDGGEKISILMECNDVIGLSSMCIGEQVFVRVD